jgi:uncharacterized protein (TIGR02217 family)
VTPLDQRIGVGDGVTTTFALSKLYQSGAATYTRPIRKAVAGTVVVALAADPKVEGQEVTIDPDAGLVTFLSPPDIGTIITAGFEFDVPVRFDIDRIQTSVATFNAGEVPNVPVVEVRL